MFFDLQHYFWSVWTIFTKFWSIWQDLKILHFCKIAQSALLQDLSKFHTDGIRWNFSRINWFSNYNTKFEVSGPFSSSFDPFDRICGCRTATSALLQDLSKFPTFDIRQNLVESIDFQITAQNIVCLDRFHQILIHLAGLKIFAFLQKS